MPIRSLLCLFAVLLAVEVQSQSADEKAVVARIELLRLAMVNADGKSLRDVTADELSYGHSSGKVEGKDSFVESIVNGKSDFVSIELTEQSIKITGDVAIVRHTMTGQTNDGGKLGAIKISVLLVWQKQKRQWKLVARQATKLQ
jgi:ketosteroid isomerase-like protein